ncbi:MAG: hypothetical protein J7545_01205 [Roseofilum sp. SBFL]|uniref:hypothetical protein n=1 Tax=unclassified Roseofilum TaxID=2620099 RepID=UPI001AFD771B|nr:MULTISPECIES: hypothetical protein [unclassified Roseofilum]MBP0013790.1 hypothetical protein [Roseofilum sp. SID3]MBP0026242.1 hypothetical protein [Roseofilum sp. SID2]MBP0040584.1 hypothetical protein [Roseofilum sp. SBFL]
MKATLGERLLHLMSDGNWHSTEELVEKISHRFSATMHTLKKRGYQFDKRHVEKNQYEYRLIQ